MCVVLGRNERSRDDENAAVLDRHSIDERYHGIQAAKTHPPYVFGIRGASCLVHKIHHVTIHWYRIAGHHGELLVKMKRPVLIAETPCAQSFRLDPDIARTCKIPNEDALLCGRCHGEGATFPKRGRARKSGLPRQEAHVKLGCVVQGY